MKILHTWIDVMRSDSIETEIEMIMLPGILGDTKIWDWNLLSEDLREQKGSHVAFKILFREYLLNLRGRVFLKLESIGKRELWDLILIKFLRDQM